MNELLLYLAACLALTVAIARLGRGALQAMWIRIAGWVLCATCVGFMLWTVGFCGILPSLGAVTPPEGKLGWLICLYAGGMLAFYAIAAFAPFHLLLLVWYALRFGSEPRGWRSILPMAALLALPLAVWVLYADLSFSFGDWTAAGPRAGLAFVAGWGGLVIPRLLPPFGPGKLVRKT